MAELILKLGKIFGGFLCGGGLVLLELLCELTCLFAGLLGRLLEGLGLLLELLVVAEGFGLSLELLLHFFVAFAKGLGELVELAGLLPGEGILHVFDELLGALLLGIPGGFGGPFGEVEGLLGLLAVSKGFTLFGELLDGLFEVFRGFAELFGFGEAAGLLLEILLVVGELALQISKGFFGLLWGVGLALFGTLQGGLDLVFHEAVGLVLGLAQCVAHGFDAIELVVEFVGVFGDVVFVELIEHAPGAASSFFEFFKGVFDKGLAILLGLMLEGELFGLGELVPRVLESLRSLGTFGCFLISGGLLELLLRLSLCELCCSVELVFGSGPGSLEVLGGLFGLAEGVGLDLVEATLGVHVLRLGFGELPGLLPHLLGSECLRLLEILLHGLAFGCVSEGIVLHDFVAEGFLGLGLRRLGYLSLELVADLVGEGEVFLALFLVACVLGELLAGHFRVAAEVVDGFTALFGCAFLHGFLEGGGVLLELAAKEWHTLIGGRGLLEGLAELGGVFGEFGSLGLLRLVGLADFVLRCLALLRVFCELVGPSLGGVDCVIAFGVVAIVFESGFGC